MSDEPTQSLGGADPDRTRSTAPVAGAPRAFPAAPIPARIGRYKVLRVLGEGGMGTVYEAEQDQPKRAVALKVIRAGYLSPQLLKRFEHESAVLGRLQHPGIAQVYEAGTVEDERGHPVPFFAMEFIRGVPLTEYASQKNLGTRERLDLVARICDAVYHAHQKGVIHRDLKPGNILVDDSGQPKILDFGVARATDSDIQQTTMQTDVGAIVGTIPYMSPEQVGGDPDELDTRSDVYALGVIAYELLAGRLPYDLQRKMIHEAARIIKEEEPTRLSSINRTLRGDVETIVAKALEKDKVRRYQSAESLASDIRRYLKDEPIAARPASTWYQVQKFSRRNRGLVTGLATAFVLLIAGLIGTGIGLKQATAARDNERAARTEADLQKDAAIKAREAEERERKAAEAQRDKAEKIAEFMSDTLKGAGPSVALGRDITMLTEMIDAAAARIESGDLKGVPEAELRLRLTIGDTYRQLAVFDGAAKILGPVLALSNTLHHGDHPDVASSMVSFAGVRESLGHEAEADLLYAQALAMSQRLYSGNHPVVAGTLNNLALVRKKLGRAAEAESLHEQALEMRRKLYPRDHEDVAGSLSGLASARESLGRASEAEPIFAHALEMHRRLYPGDHPEVAKSLNNLAHVLQSLGRATEAEPLYVQALEMHQRLFQGDHPKVAQSLNNLAYLRVSLERAAKAEPLFVQALEMYQRLFPGDHPGVAMALNNLAFARDSLGRSAEAETIYAQALEMQQRLYPGDHPDVANSLKNLASLRSSLRRADAEPLGVQALEMYQRLFPGDHPGVANSLNNLAHTRQSLGRAAEAEPMYAQALEMNQRLFPGDHPQVAISLNNLGWVRESLGRAAEAELSFEQALSMHRRLFSGDHPHTANSLINLARVRSTLGRAAEAELLYAEALDMHRRLLTFGHSKTQGTLITLAQLYDSLGSSTKAELLWRELLEFRAGSLPAGDWRTASARSRLGGSILAQSRFDVAEPLLIEGYDGLAAAKNTPRTPRDVLREACERALKLYESWDRAEPGKGYDAKVAEWNAKLDAITPPTEPATSEKK